MISGRDIVIPSGPFGAIYGAWPFLVIPLCSFFFEFSWKSISLVLVGATCGAVRAWLWLRHRRRNRVRVVDQSIEITSSGQGVVLSVDQVEELEWIFGHPSATFDRMHDYTMFVASTPERTEIVELLLPRVHDQRRALAELGTRLPQKRWSVGWTVMSDRKVSWNPAADAKPPRRLSVRRHG
jgi:hypothetical protein